LADYFHEKRRKGGNPEKGGPSTEQKREERKEGKREKGGKRKGVPIKCVASGLRYLRGRKKEGI